MKIAWFSPRVPDHTEIAKNTERLEGELKRQFEPRFLAERPAGFEEPDADAFFHASLGHVPTELVLALKDVDVPVYNLGNNPTFFAKTWFLSQCRPGIVILHDLKLHHTASVSATKSSISPSWRNTTASRASKRAGFIGSSTFSSTSWRRISR